MRASAGPFRHALCAWLALAGMALASAGPLAIGHSAGDPDFAPFVSGSHDHTAHRLGVAPDPGPAHCIACHLARWAGNAAPRTRPSVAVARPHDTVAATSHSRRSIDQSPGVTRGPPSSIQSRF